MHIVNKKILFLFNEARFSDIVKIIGNELDYNNETNYKGDIILKKYNLFFISIFTGQKTYRVKNIIELKSKI